MKIDDLQNKYICDDELNFFVYRKFCKTHYTIGYIYADRKKLCNTLEDTCRDGGTKIPKETCIPTNGCTINGKTAPQRYPIYLTYSPKYKRIMPLIDRVPDFQGIRIHAGNTNKDTEGCLLCGENKEVGKVLNSTYWTKVVTDLITKANNEGKKIYITFFK